MQTITTQRLEDLLNDEWYGYFHFSHLYSTYIIDDVRYRSPIIEINYLSCINNSLRAFDIYNKLCYFANLDEHSILAGDKSFVLTSGESFEQHFCRNFDDPSAIPIGVLYVEHEGYC